MANRATEAEVLELLDTTLEEEDITPFLDAANMVVSGKCTGVEYGDSELKLIEVWLAAHFASVRDPQISKEKVGEANWTYDGKTGMGLNLTRYGQQVKILDYKSTLAELDGTKGTAELKTLI